MKPKHTRKTRNQAAVSRTTKASASADALPDVADLAYAIFEGNCLIGTVMRSLTETADKSAAVTLALALAKLQPVERALRHAERASREAGQR